MRRPCPRAMLCRAFAGYCKAEQRLVYPALSLLIFFVLAS
jgi:hypothetical protein